jgi:hypothetical protein
VIRFLIREDLGDDLLDAELPRDDACGCLVVARHHHDPHAIAFEQRHGIRRTGLDGIGDAHEPGERAIDRDVHDGLAVGTQVLDAARKRGRIDALALHHRPISERDDAPTDTAAHALTRDRREVRDVEEADAALLRTRDDRCRERVFAGPLEARRETEQGRFVARSGDDGHETRPTLGQGAGLVDHQRIDLAHRFDRFGVAEQHA